MHRCARGARFIYQGPVSIRVGDRLGRPLGAVSFFISNAETTSRDVGISHRAGAPLSEMTHLVAGTIGKQGSNLFKRRGGDHGRRTVKRSMWQERAALLRSIWC